MDDETVDSCTRTLLSCLGEVSRYRLVRALAERELCVGELALAVGLSQSCTTRHLQALERAGLVRGQREGRKVRFRLVTGNTTVEPLLTWALSGSEPVPAAPRPVPAPAKARSSREKRAESDSGPAASARVTEQPSAEASEGSVRTTGRPGDLEDFLL